MIPATIRSRRPHLLRTRLSVVAIPLALLLAPACRTDAPQPRRVVFIVLDALRTDRLSLMGYARSTSPHLDELATGAVVFENHFAQETSTRRSLPQLLYSRYWAPPLSPGSAQIPVSAPSELVQGFDSESMSLPRILSRAGLLTAGISAHSWLLEDSSLAREFDEFHDLASTTQYRAIYAYPRADQVTDAALDWLDRHPDDEFFLYLHYMDTHFPHLLEQEGRELLDSRVDVPTVAARFSPTGIPSDRSSRLAGGARKYLDALYDGDIVFVDRHLGRLFDSLRKRRILDHTLVVVTSDHGEHLLETEGRFEHGGPWYDAVARIPLVISYPAKLEPARHTGLSGMVDVAPTVLRLLDVHPPRGVRLDGEDLIHYVLGRAPQRGLILSPLGARSGSEKLILSRRVLCHAKQRFTRGDWAVDPDTLPVELYDLAIDPAETENLSAARPERVRELLSVYAEAMAPLYRRHAAAQRSNAPGNAFAIGARHFLLGTERATREDSCSRRGETARALPDGWTIEPHPNHPFLRAAPGARALLVEVPVPDGVYKLSASVRGRLTIRPEGGSATDIPTEPRHEAPRSREDERTDGVQVGRIEIRGGRFRAEIALADPRRPAQIHYLGFTPEGTDREQQEEVDARLRTLGYID